ncbi:MAG: PAS domain S-box protein [Proteobacteria bacterium]|nr:PAS domain S-box protein [Pseudomonadota bacterium]
MEDEHKTAGQLLKELQFARNRVTELEEAPSKRLKVELTLHKSEKHYRSLFENMLNGIAYCQMIFDQGLPQDLIFLEVNNNFEGITGLTDVIGKKWSEIIPVTKQADKGLFDFFGRVVMTGIPDKEEFFNAARNRWYSISVYYLEQENFVMVFDVITDRKRKEEELRENEERYRLITDNITDIVITVDKSGRYTFVSPSHKKVLGRGEEVIGTSAFEHIHPDDRDALVKNFKSVVPDMGVERSEYRYLHPTRGYIWLESEGTFIDMRGVRTGVVATREITSRKRAEESLKESEERFRLLFNSMVTTFSLLEAVYTENGQVADLRFLEVNPAFEQSTGQKADVFIGRTICDLRSDNKGKDLVDRLSGVILSGEPIFFETYVESIDKHLETSAYSPKPGQVAVLSLDVTERKKAEEEKKKLEARLQQAYKMEAIGSLAGGIAHDFNNILSAVIGFSELARHMLDSGDRIDNEINEIYKAGLRARELVKQILTFSRQADIKREPMDVLPHFKETLKFLRASLPVTIEIKKDFPDHGCIIMADSTQMHQLLMNLCTNAAHAMKDHGGIIDICVREVEMSDTDEWGVKQLKPGRYLRLDVSDTGCGISEELVNRIFDPFFTTKKRGEGTGMGLSVVHGIVKDMGGTISVYSYPGKGTTFNLFFPLHEGETVTTPSPEPAVKTGSGRILLVDDEEGVLASERGVLEHLGYTVLSTTRPAEAIEMFTAMPDQFDLVLTDLTMPGMTGLELSERLSQIRPGIPIVLCTGYGIGITPQKLAEAGIREVVIKPMTTSELSEAVYRALNMVN